MNLYKIPESLADILEIEDEALREEEIKNLKMKVDNTFLGLVNFIKNKESDCEEIDREIERLKNIKRIRKNKVEFLKGYIQTFMEMNAIKKKEFPNFTISVVNNPPSVSILHEHLISEKYKYKVEEEKIDKIAIRDDIKSGVVVTGAELETKKSLRIK